jgi:hypothetical protein
MNKLTVNDGYEIVSKKILVGKISKLALEKQIQYSTTAIKLQNYITNIAKQKIELVSKLENVFEKQLSEFVISRQQECMDIYVQINHLDQPTLEQNNLILQLDELDNEMKKLYEQIEAIERTIPIDKIVTQFNLSSNRNKQV